MLIPVSFVALASPAAAAEQTPSRFTAVSPVRVLDTRNGTGGYFGQVPGGTSATLNLSAYVPASATAVVLNVTGVSASEATFVTVYPAGTTLPTASNINLVAGEIRPNAVTVALGANRTVQLFNFRGRLDMVADLAGYYAPDQGVKFASMNPTRVLDTRVTGTPVGPRGSITLDLSSVVPQTATAVTFNLTGTEPTYSTFATAWPAGTPLPTASNLNLVAGQTAPNFVTVALGADRKISLYNHNGYTHLIADVAGYYSKTASLAFVPNAPVRTLDTRIQGGKVGAGGKVYVTVPQTAKRIKAVVANLTGTEPTASTYVAADEGPRPSTSNLNLVAGQTSANLAIVPASTSFPLWNLAGSVHLIADIAGVFVEGCEGSGCVFSWGVNAHGELGGTTSAYSTNEPSPISGLSGIVDIDGGATAGVALRGDGAVFAWGESPVGPGNARPIQLSGLADVIAVSAGNKTGLALKSDRTVWNWGETFDGGPSQVAGLAGITGIVAGALTSYAVDGNGDVWAWGHNRFGSWGNGTTCDDTTGTNCHTITPVRVSGLTGVIALSDSGFALKADQTVWTWGDNSFGLLGTGNPSGSAFSTVPVQVPGLTDVVAIDGLGSSRFAVRSDGTVWAWGANDQGQLGNGTFANSAQPVKVTGLEEVRDVTSGDTSAYAVTASGAAWSWGSDLNGQLGVGNAPGGRSNVPVLINGLSGVEEISAFSQGALALVPEPSPSR